MSDSALWLVESVLPVGAMTLTLSGITPFNDIVLMVGEQIGRACTGRPAHWSTKRHAATSLNSTPSADGHLPDRGRPVLARGGLTDLLQTANCRYRGASVTSGGVVQ
ncbi:hypothetical protein [Streptomyces sp. NPDC001948]